MAEFESKHEDNVDGRWYVDDQCIDCDVCRENAADMFSRNEDEGYSYVSRQPTTDDEEEMCQDASEACPVEAIGSV